MQLVAEFPASSVFEGDADHENMVALRCSYVWSAEGLLGLSAIARVSQRGGSL